MSKVPSISKVINVEVNVPINIVTNNIPVTIQHDPRNFPIVDFGYLSPYLKNDNVCTHAVRLGFFQLTNMALALTSSPQE